MKKIFILSLFLFFPTLLVAATEFYVDPDYSGSVKNGSASNPWTALGYNPTTSQWVAINAALANGPVTIYFSAREASSDIPDEIIGQVNVARTDVNNTNRLTLDGMSKYNTDDTNPVWLDYSGNSKMRIKVVSNSFSIGWEGKTNRQNYVTIRGFEVTGSTGRITFKGSHFILENIWSHDITSVGATVQLNNATDQNCVDYGREADITIRNNLIERGEGEGIYIGGNYEYRYGGCDTYGLTHDNILIENNTIRFPGTNGGEGDGIDVKVGITNITIRNNIIEGGPIYTRGIVESGLYLIPKSIPQNLVIEGNKIFNRQGKGIEIANANGAIIRNNIVYNATQGGIGTTGSSGDSEYNSNVKIYNNTIYGSGGFGLGDAQNVEVKNNLVSGVTGFQISQWGSSNIISDYNLFPSDTIILNNWTTSAYGGNPNNEAHSTRSSPTASIFEDSSSGNFHLISSNLAIDKGVDVSSSGFNYDFDKVNRPQGAGWDIGAYEYAGVINPTSPPLSPTPVPSPVPIPTPLPGDLNSDHTVNSLDFSIMNSYWYTSNTTADLNSDGSVNSLDYAILSNNWGKTW